MKLLTSKAARYQAEFSEDLPAPPKQLFQLRRTDVLTASCWIFGEGE